VSVWADSPQMLDAVVLRRVLHLASASSSSTRRLSTPSLLVRGRHRRNYENYEKLRACARAGSPFAQVGRALSKNVSDLVQLPLLAEL
jgi:hypothetical protein